MTVPLAEVAPAKTSSRHCRQDAQLFKLSTALETYFSIVIYNIGIDHYLSNDIVVDIRAGKGLTPDSDDLFAGVGGGLRSWTLQQTNAS